MDTISERFPHSWMVPQPPAVPTCWTLAPAESKPADPQPLTGLEAPFEHFFTGGRIAKDGYELRFRRTPPGRHDEILCRPAVADRPRPVYESGGQPRPPYHRGWSRRRGRRLESGLHARTTTARSPAWLEPTATRDRRGRILVTVGSPRSRPLLDRPHVRGCSVRGSAGPGRSRVCRRPRGIHDRGSPLSDRRQVARKDPRRRHRLEDWQDDRFEDLIPYDDPGRPPGLDLARPLLERLRERLDGVAACPTQPTEPTHPRQPASPELARHISDGCSSRYTDSVTKRLVDIDDALLAEVRVLMGAVTMKEAVNSALQEVIDSELRRRHCGGSKPLREPTWPMTRSCGTHGASAGVPGRQERPRPAPPPNRCAPPRCWSTAWWPPRRSSTSRSSTAPGR